MKAAVLREVGQPLNIEELAVPSPGEGEALVRIEASGVCHSDIHLADGDWPGVIARRVQPTILGHEVVGRVEQLGPGADSVGVGDRVGLGWLCSTCGECYPCRDGHENLCLDRRVTGVDLRGGYAEFVAAPASHLIRIPEGLDPAQTAPLFCAGVTVHRAVKKAAIEPGQRVGVFGIGGLGHIAVQLAKLQGAEVVAVDLTDDKLELAHRCGAAHTFNAADAKKGIRQLGGLHAAVVTSAAKPAYDTAIRCLRKQARLVIVGLPKEDLTFFADYVVMGEFLITGSSVGTRDDIREILDLAASGKVECQVERVKLEEINQAFDRLRSGDLTGRIVLTF